MTRCARERRVFFFEEPVFEPRRRAASRTSTRDGGVMVVVPRLPHGLDAGGVDAAQRRLLDELIARTSGSTTTSLWYYTPMALAFTRSSGAARDRLRLHGRAVGLQGRAARADAARGASCCARADARLHRRPDALRGQARPPRATSIPFRAASTSAHFAQARAAARRAGRPGGDSASAARLLRRDRRADGPRRCSTASPPRGPTGSS